MQSPHLNIAIRSARRAGDILRRERGRLDRHNVDRKGRFDYVSEVDRACERAIIDSIHQAFPDHEIQGEESGQHGSSRYRWIVDPLDGTSNFLHDIPHYAVSIALSVDNRIEHGVIYDPIREELFTASRGRGALLNNHKLRCSARLNLDGALLATGFPFRRRKLLEAHLSMCGDFFRQIEDLRRAGTACLDLAYVAAGRVDGFWEMGLQPWDVAAGALLVREAGGIAVDFAGGEAFLDSGNIIAAPYKLIAPMQQVIGKHWK